jgi:TolA-binding protein
MSQALFLILSLFISPQGGPDEQYNFVIGLAEKGLHEQVIREAGDFLKSYPEHPKAVSTRYRLASAFYSLNRLDEAAANYSQLADLEGFEFRAESGLRLAQCELAKEQFTKAAATLEQVLSLDKEYLYQPATFLLAEAWFRATEYEKASIRYNEVKDVEDYAKDSMYGLTWCAYRLKNYQQAVLNAEAFSARFVGDPLVPEMQFLAGEAYLDLEQNEKALVAYQKVTAGPFADAAMRGAGFAAAKGGDHVASAAFFGRLATEFPQSRFHVEALLQQGIHLLKTEANAEALQVLLSADLNMNPDALYWRAQAQQRNGLKEDAIATLEAGMAADPSAELRGRMASARGDILFDLGRHDEATAAYGEAESDYSLHAASVASLNGGEADRAVELARKLVETFPDSPYLAKAQLALGEGLLQLKEYAAAAEAFAATAAADEGPAHRSRALSRKAWCHYLLKDLEPAAAGFALVYQEFPQAIEAEEAFYMSGRCEIELENDAKAAQIWLAYLDAYPDSSRKAELLLRLGRMDSSAEGMKHLEELVAGFGDSALAPRALMELAENHYKEGNLAAAEESFTKILTTYPNNELAPAAGYGLGWCLYDGERYTEAADILRQVTAITGAEGAVKIQQSAFELRIWAEQKAGNADGAFEAYQGFVASDPGEARLFEAARAVASALRDGGQVEKASTLLASVAKDFEGGERAAESMLEVIYLELEQQNVEAAAQSLATAMELAPQNPAIAEAAFFVGEAWFNQGEYQKAVDAYGAAADVENCPVAAEAKYKMGFTLLRADNVADAAIAFGRVVSDHPGHALYGESTFLYGECLFRLGQYKEAAAQFTTLRSNSPMHQVMPKNLFRLGMSLFQLENYADADRILTELITKYPDFSNNTEGELWRGRSLAAMDKTRAAQQAFERVLANDKGVLSARAYLGIGKLQLAAEDIESAMSSFLKVAVLYGTEAEVSEALYYAGICLEKQGDPKRAAQQFNDILTRYPQGAWAAQAQERLDALR